jgi:hypothetical protein
MWNSVPTFLYALATLTDAPALFSGGLVALLLGTVWLAVVSLHGTRASVHLSPALLGTRPCEC